MLAVRVVILFFLTMASLESHGQTKYTAQKAIVDFASEAELELIKASSSEVRGIIDPSNSQFAFSVDVKTFKGFNSALQREHFNEKYMEIEKFPKASFSGKIIEHIDFTKNGTYDVRAKGDLDIHGVKQIRIIKSKITVANGTLNVESKFLVPLSDHNISIPTIVSQKIATEIQVDFVASLVLQPL